MLYLVFEKKSKLKESVIDYIKSLHLEFEVVESEDILVDTQKIARKVSEKPQEHRAIIVDEDGIGPFMVATKVPKIICAMLNDEQSALMTRDHNNANMITIGDSIIGHDVALGIIERFVTHEYAGGRHQMRVDMLNSMIDEVN